MVFKDEEVTEDILESIGLLFLTPEEVEEETFGYFRFMFNANEGYAAQEPEQELERCWWCGTIFDYEDRIVFCAPCSHILHKACYEDAKANSDRKCHKCQQQILNFCWFEFVVPRMSFGVPKSRMFEYLASLTCDLYTTFLTMKYPYMELQFAMAVVVEPGADDTAPNNGSLELKLLLVWRGLWVDVNTIAAKDLMWRLSLLENFDRYIWTFPAATEDEESGRQAAAEEMQGRGARVNVGPLRHRRRLSFWWLGVCIEASRNGDDWGQLTRLLLRLGNAEEEGVARAQALGEELPSLQIAFGLYLLMLVMILNEDRKFLW